MKKSATGFQVVNLSSQADGLDQPVLVSFPHNMPPPAQLSQMKFNLYQEVRDPSKTTAQQRVKKRVLKSAYKALKYESSSMQADIKDKAQASDYYIGVYDSVKNKCYALPIDAAYQMTQTIDGFSAKFGVSADMDVKNMNYYEQKKLQIGTFGTGKAQRKLASVMANQVDE